MASWVVDVVFGPFTHSLLRGPYSLHPAAPYLLCVWDPRLHYSSSSSVLTENEFLQPLRALALHRALGSPVPRSDFWDPPSNLSTASGWAHHAARSSFPRATRSRALQPPEIKDHGFNRTLASPSEDKTEDRLDSRPDP
jgi:hypothetical protein